MREIKSALRKELIAKRKAMDAAKKAAADESIFRQLVPLVNCASSVFCYVSTEIEVDTRRIIGYCLSNNIPVALPVSGENELSFYYIDNINELKNGRYNIDEPPINRPAYASEKTLCIVPALCADKEGYRLGYGKGYYDRFLKSFKGTSVIICYKDFKCEVPKEAHDIQTTFTIFDK